MPELKITYFDFPGRAEALRLALCLGNIPFQDERLHPHEFAEMRSGLPYKSLPIITVDGNVYAQSSAILRYIGKLSGLYPSVPEDGLRVDEVIDTVLEFISGIGRIDEEDEVAYERDMTQYLTTAIPRYLGGLESRLAIFNNSSWAVGSTITVADLAIYVCVLNVKAGAWDFFDLEQLRPFSRLMQVAEAVRNHPAVEAWNAKIAEQAAVARKKRDKIEADFAAEL